MIKAWQCGGVERTWLQEVQVRDLSLATKLKVVGVIKIYTVNQQHSTQDMIRSFAHEMVGGQASS